MQWCSGRLRGRGWRRCSLTLEFFLVVLHVEETKEEEILMAFEIGLPAMPRCKEDCMRMWSRGYVAGKEPLSSMLITFLGGIFAF